MQSITVSDNDTLSRAEILALRRGISVAEIVNEALRAGLERLAESAAPAAGRVRRFQTQPHPMGLRPECNLDNIQELLDAAEGEAAR